MIEDIIMSCSEETTLRKPEPKPPNIKEILKLKAEQEAEMLKRREFIHQLNLTIEDQK